MRMSGRPRCSISATTVNDWINSDFDDETQALKPNVEDAASHAGDYTLPATDNLNDGHAQGRRPHRADAFGRRKRVLHDLRRLRHLRLPAGRFRGRGAASTWMRTPPPTAADGLCDKCGLCLHEKDENGLCTVEGLPAMSAWSAAARRRRPSPARTRATATATRAIRRSSTSPSPRAGTPLSRARATAARSRPSPRGSWLPARLDARADTNTSDGSSNGIYSDDYVTEMLAWIATATQDDLDNMDQQRHDAIFGKHQKDKPPATCCTWRPTIENGKEVEKVSHQRDQRPPPASRTCPTTTTPAASASTRPTRPAWRRWSATTSGPT